MVQITAHLTPTRVVIYAVIIFITFMLGMQIMHKLKDKF